MPCARCIVIALAGAALLGCGSSDTPVDEPAEFVAVKRAWAPGERDSTIAWADRTGAFGAYGQDLASAIFADPDSVVVIQRNPLFGLSAMSGMRGLLFSPQSPEFSASWLITGIDIRTVYEIDTPPDTVDWLGIFWANPADSTWKGFAVVFSRTETVAATYIDTPAFDAANGKSGGGAGEVRGTTYWEAEGQGAGANNKLSVTSASYGAASTVVSGIWTGGTRATGTISGRAKKINLDRITGSFAPNQFDIDLDFSNLQSVALTCIMPSPCTSTDALRLHLLSREARAGRPVPASRIAQLMLGVAAGGQ